MLAHTAQRSVLEIGETQIIPVRVAYSQGKPQPAPVALGPSQPTPPGPQLGLLSKRPADPEFLPAALEILVTPPSPVARAMLLSICALFVFAIGWSYFAWIDMYAEAPGKVQPSGRSKVVQPLEAGTVVAIHVENGSRVNAGDVLLVLDPTETAADREAQARDLEAASAEAARRRVAIVAARTGRLKPLPIEFPAVISEAARAREESVFVAELNQLNSTIASLNGQLAEKAATKQRLGATIAARRSSSRSPRSGWPCASRSMPGARARARKPSRRCSDTRHRSLLTPATAVS